MEGDLLVTTLTENVSHISIHTLRMEGDVTGKVDRSYFYISIHTLRMEGDDGGALYLSARILFQSTPSAWRVTAPCPHLGG